MPVTLLIILTAIAFMAGVLLAWALRGRRIDDHPLCRRCRYDLCGAASIPKICPECGTELTKRRSVRIGHRRKHWVTVAIAVLMLAGSLGVGGIVGWRNSHDYDWNRAKPVWWLKRDADSDDMKRSAVAVGELLRRLTDRTLNDGQIQDLVESALDVQGNVSIRWNSNWGEIIEQTWTQDQVTDAQLERYLRQMVEPAVTVQTRQRVRENSILRYLVAYDELRVARQSAFRVMRVTDSLEFGDYRGEGSAGFASSGRTTGGEVVSEIAPGAHELRMEIRFVLMTDEERKRWRPHGNRSVDRERIDAIETLAEFDMVLTSTIDVVPADQPTFEFVDDPALREAVRASLSIDSVRVYRVSGGEARIGAHVSGIAPPIDLALMISVRIGGNEIPLEPFVAAAPIGDHTLVSGRGRIDEDPAITADLTHMDFVFRPNTEIAEEQFAGFDRIYGGPEIVIENVPVEILRVNKGE